MPTKLMLITAYRVHKNETTGEHRSLFLPEKEGTNLFENEYVQVTAYNKAAIKLPANFNSQFPQILLT